MAGLHTVLISLPRGHEAQSIRDLHPTSRERTDCSGRRLVVQRAAGQFRCAVHGIEACSSRYRAGVARAGAGTPAVWITSSQNRAADYPRGMDDDDSWMGTPNCPVCLARMWPSGMDEKPYWYCPSCRLPRIV